MTIMLQPEDDHERVREAVARTLAVGLMSEDFSVDLNDWLNPTEVRCGIIYIVCRYMYGTCVFLFPGFIVRDCYIVIYYLVYT